MKKILFAFLFLMSFARIFAEDSVFGELTSDEQPILITSYFKDWEGSDDSARFITLEINFKNISSKTIKYVHFEVIPYNRVNDEISDERYFLRGFSEPWDTKRRTVKFTGPVKPGRREDPNFENVWYSKEFKYYKIGEKCKVEYDDGTSGIYRLKFAR